MSQLSRLIAELCPTGVEHRPLGSVGEFVRGGGLQKSDLQGSGHPAIHYGQIHTVYGVWTTTTKSYVAPDKAARLRRAKPGDVVLATTSEDDAAVGKATAWLGDEEAAVSGDAFIFRHRMDPRFVSYFFASTSFQRQKRPFISGAKVRRLSGTDLARIVIPVPPLEVQREIVRILDHFTELEAALEAELEAELEARRRQYAFYRDSLLRFSESERVRWVSMSDLGTIFGGLTGKSKADFSGGSARFVSYTNVFSNPATELDKPDFVRVGPSERQRHLALGDILLTGSSESLAEVAMSSVVTRPVREPLYLNSFCIGFRLSDPTHLVPNFAKHLFRSRTMRNQLVGTASGVTRFNVSKARLGRVLVPLPPIKEQHGIARALDAFDSLASDLSVGLPAELAARRRQYEYYRDKLLTFEEAR